MNDARRNIDDSAFVSRCHSAVDNRNTLSNTGIDVSDTTRATATTPVCARGRERCDVIEEVKRDRVIRDSDADTVTTGSENVRYRGSAFDHDCDRTGKELGHEVAFAVGRSGVVTNCFDIWDSERNRLVVRTSFQLEHAFYRRMIQRIASETVDSLSRVDDTLTVADSRSRCIDFDGHSSSMANAISSYAGNAGHSLATHAY